MAVKLVTITTEPCSEIYTQQIQVYTDNSVKNKKHLTKNAHATRKIILLPKVWLPGNLMQPKIKIYKTYSLRYPHACHRKENH